MITYPVIRNRIIDVSQLGLNSEIITSQSELFVTSVNTDTDVTVKNTHTTLRVECLNNYFLQKNSENLNQVRIRDKTP